MTEQEDEIRLKDLLDIYSKEQYKEIIEILNRDQKRYHKDQLILSGVSQQRGLLNALADDFNNSTDTYVGQTRIEEVLKAFNCG